MSEVNEANSVLSDVERRAAYDALGAGRHAGEYLTLHPIGTQVSYSGDATP